MELKSLGTLVRRTKKKRVYKFKKCIKANSLNNLCRFSDYASLKLIVLAYKKYFSNIHENFSMLDFSNITS